MGDRYRPDRAYDRNPPPPPWHEDSRRSNDGRRYDDPRGYQNEYGGGGHSSGGGYQNGYGGGSNGQPYDRYSNDYSFHGAAGRDPTQQYRPSDPRDFSFRAPGPQNIRFPSPDRDIPRQPRNALPPKPHWLGEPSSQQATHGQPPARRENAYSARGRSAPRGRGGFGPFRAADREIVQAAFRERTPEQLPGMNSEGQVRFNPFGLSSEEEEDMRQSTDDSDNEEGEISAKRFKRDRPESDANTVPKWSNPDPHASLAPIPQPLSGPKKDLVQAIRKAKAEAAPLSETINAVKENVDFISFDISDPDDELPIQEIPRGKKRKATAISKDYSAIAPKWLPGPNEDPTPWFRIDDRIEVSADDFSHQDDTKLLPGMPPIRNKYPLASKTLHQEIVDFHDFVRPHDHEEVVRRELITRVERAVRQMSVFSNAQIKCFGSFASGLYLPTADMDLVAVSPYFLKRGEKMYGKTNSQIRKLGNHLVNAGIAAEDTMQPVLKARVPLVKIVDRKTDIRVDISFENMTGVDALRTFETWKPKFPAMPILVAVIKQFLAMRELNEVFTGGLGGYSIICMVVSMFQMHPEFGVWHTCDELYFGEMLLRFFNIYGTTLDIRTNGIRVANCRGHSIGYFNKYRNPAPKQNLSRLTIIDPNNPENDISGGSHNIDKVRAAFRQAETQLHRCMNDMEASGDVNKSILGCILGGSYASFARQRDRLRAIHQGRPLGSLAQQPKKKKGKKKR